MPYRLKPTGDKIGVYKLNGKLVKKFKTKATANKMIKIWNSYEKRNKRK